MADQVKQRLGFEKHNIFYDSWLWAVKMSAGITSLAAWIANKNSLHEYTQYGGSTDSQ